MTWKTPEAILLAAADLIEEKGWTQKDFAKKPNAVGDLVPTVPRDPEATCFCAIGAMRRVSYGPDTLLSPAVDRAIEKMAVHVGSTFVTDWNDEPGRTKEEVVAALRGAAA